MTAKALLFSGQGAQFVGMGKDLAEAYPEAKQIFDQANDVLGYDLAAVCFEGPEEKLTRSNYAQPAIFAASAACYAALKEEKADAQFVAAAGLSLGEWTALYATGVLTLEDTLKTLSARGTYMQEACEQNPGGMLSVIGLDVDKVKEIAEKAGLQVANLNSPAQIVLSGPKDAIPEGEKLAGEAGAKRAIPLKVAGAFHSKLMQPAAEKLAAFFENITFSEPELPVVSNVTAEPHGGADEIKRRMIDQVTSSVRWFESIKALQAQGAQAFVECGPGKVLTGLVKRIDKQAVVHNIQDRSTLEATLGAWDG